ncbi:MAG: potassium-transporting ATPase subunit KdpC [Candidatus Acidiferrales bacterium]
MKKNLLIAIWMTIVTTVLLGLIYPLVVTGLAQALFPRQANGELIHENGKLVGSRLLGQPFSSRGYFVSRPSAAGPAGYDPTQSGGSNYAATNKALLDRVSADVAKFHSQNPNALIPADLVTASASGLDPHVSPASAEFQVPRVARERGMGETELRALVRTHTEGRQLGFLGEPRVNVLALNLDLDAHHPIH